MYEAFYGLKEKPFSLLPNPDFLYLGGRHKTALCLLEYGLLNHAGFLVVTGEPGTGKTTLLYKILAEAKSYITVGLITNTHSSFSTLMPWIFSAFGLSSKGKDPVELYEEFTGFLRQQCARNRRVMIIVDEAQHLRPELLEELRLLSNANADTNHVLQVILSGQPGLRTLLQQPEMTQFAQRIAVDYSLGPLEEEETRAYIRHRLQRAGGNPLLFTDHACLLTHQVTGGIPRLVNQVCDTALAYGFAEQVSHITNELIAEVVRDREKGGIIPLVRQPEVAALIVDEKSRNLHRSMA
jgi:type II secretory pathway predicted ATPase ExeA